MRLKVSHHANLESRVKMNFRFFDREERWTLKFVVKNQPKSLSDSAPLA